MIHSIDHQFKSNGMYPNNLSEYYEIIQHPKSSDKSYLEEVTQGSILFPIIAAYAAKNAFRDIYKKVQEIKKLIYLIVTFRFGTLWVILKSTFIRILLGMVGFYL
ncbi:hypothetical protein [Pseudoalteromonas sp. B62]|uniref:hypothetical protein n=1 Tax=Pseudoalteromonas sp. B62 TaxID=630483 RepID=UPI00301D1DF4